MLGPKWNTYNIKFSDYTNHGYAWNASQNWNNPTPYSNNITIGTPNENFRVYECYSDDYFDGLTAYYYGGGYFSSVTIYDNLAYTAGYNYSTHQGVLTHEFGHALGLADLYGQVTSVMQGYTSERAYTTVQYDDNAGINALYP